MFTCFVRDVYTSLVLYRNSTVKIIKCCFDDQQFKVKTIKSPSLEIQRLHRVRIICSCLTMPAQDPTCRRPYFLHPLAVLPCIIWTPFPFKKKYSLYTKTQDMSSKMCTYYTYNVKIKYISSQVTVYNQLNNICENCTFKTRFFRMVVSTTFILLTL